MSESLHDKIETGSELVPVVKAHFVGDGNGPESNALVEQEKQASLFGKTGALTPPYDPNLLALIYENSSALRPNIDAYVTNIDSYGHRFKPTIDLNEPDADNKIRQALRTSRGYAFKTGKAAEDINLLRKGAEPSDQDVIDRKEQLQLEIQEEKEKLEMFFSNCTVDLPFSGPEGLRGLTRQDIETIGSGYWEVLRDGLGDVSVFNRLRSVTMRMLPLDEEITEAPVRRRVSLLDYEKVTVKKRFRKFVQMSEGGTKFAYFKEFGDPRAVSSVSGKAYATAEELEKEEPNANPATEVIQFKVSSPRSPYGVPRWIGTLLSVLGTRQAEEVNFLYFENRSIPPMAILVSGGRLNSETVSRLENYIATEIKGKHNFHKILILEAETAGAGVGWTGNGESDAGKMKIDLRPLTDAQQKDALFQQYDERNADKVGQAFRLPRLLRGDVRDFNRSTSVASVDFAEIQVFGPIRQQFDWLMNQLILPELGIKYHTFESNAPTVRDPEALADMITKLVTANVLTPEEARELSEGVFNKPIPRIDAPWTKQPIGLSLAGRGIEDNLYTPDVNEENRYNTGLDNFEDAGGMSAPGAGPTQEALGVPQTKRRQLVILQKIHNHLIEEERKQFAKMRESADVLKVPVDVFETFFAK